MLVRVPTLVHFLDNLQTLAVPSVNGALSLKGCFHLSIFLLEHPPVLCNYQISLGMKHLWGFGVLGAESTRTKQQKGGPKFPMESTGPIALFSLPRRNERNK